MFQKIILTTLFLAFVPFNAMALQGDAADSKPAAPAESQAQADKNAKPKPFFFVDLENTPDEDLQLASTLLKKRIDEAEAITKNRPIIRARKFDFDKHDKEILIVKLIGSLVCLRQGDCETYFLTKEGDKQWTVSGMTFAHDVWLDTRKSEEDFPRIVTQINERPAEYWLWSGTHYKGAWER